MMDRVPEDIRRNEEEAEHRQLEAESLVGAQRDREMFDRDSDESLGRDKGNDLNARCGLAECDCEYTIGGLLRRLEIIAEYCTAGLHPTVDKDEVFRIISLGAKLTVKQTREERGL